MKIAGDMGHGYAKCFNGGELKKIVAVLGEPQGDLIGSNSREEIETEEGRWYIGETALLQSLNKITGRDERWAFSPEYRALLLYGVSEYVSPQTDSVVIDLELSLPIADYRRHRPQLTKLLQRAHLVKRPDHRNLVVTIRSVGFLPQGFAPAKPYLSADRTVATLDLGSRNINYATFQGSRLIDSKTDSREGGATQTLLDIGKKIEQRTRRELTIPQIVETLQTKIVRAFNQPHDVSDVIDERLGYYFRFIEALISDIWGNASNLDTFVTFGGGVILAGDRLKAKFPDQMVMLDNPQFATVIALYDYLKRKTGE